MQFDTVAPYYNMLSKIVFANEISRAKTSQFNSIKIKTRVLFIGGGTGDSLSFLLSRNKELEIDFVDPSEKMMLRARKLNTNSINVNFFQLRIEDFEGGEYDVVITEFFFDLFEKEKIKTLIDQISLKLTTNGIWIDTDFRKPVKFVDKYLLRIMYFFFKVYAGIESSSLNEVEPIFTQAGLVIKKEHKSSTGFITSRLFVRI
jgi:ubiquinone/menaquinone biosynthesis C-methylase UbiE